MNRPPTRARIVVRARDPLLRSQIVERLAGLGDVETTDSGPEPRGTGAEGRAAAEITVEQSGGDTDLTQREIEVLGLLADGLANKEIAARLGFSVHTAKFHVESRFRKLDAVNRAEAVREGIRHGFIGM